MKLNYKELGEGEPLIILHGLFGSLDNWYSLGKILAEQYHVFLVDVRNHGQSPHSEEFTYDAMAADLKEFIEDRGLEKAIVLGHSMGGKIAMVTALNTPEVISKLIVVDIAPRTYEVHHRTILDGLLSLDFSTIESRGEADEQLANYIANTGVRQFLLKSLYWKEKDQLGLRFNLDVLNKEIEPISSWKDRNTAFDGQALFIRGGKSDYILPEDPSVHLHFPEASIVTVENAGHWVHAEAPSELLKIVKEFIEK